MSALLASPSLTGCACAHLSSHDTQPQHGKRRTHNQASAIQPRRHDAASCFAARGGSARPPIERMSRRFSAETQRPRTQQSRPSIERRSGFGYGPRWKLGPRRRWRTAGHTCHSASTSSRTRLYRPTTTTTRSLGMTAPCLRPYRSRSRARPRVAAAAADRGM